MKKVWIQIEGPNVKFKTVNFRSNVIQHNLLKVSYINSTVGHWISQLGNSLLLMNNDTFISKFALYKVIWLTVPTEVFQICVWFPQPLTPALDLTSAGDCDLISAARRDVRGHEPACLVVVNVECDVTLIRVQAARGGGRKLLWESRHFPSCCPRAKVNVVLTSQAQFQEVKKSLSTLKGSREKTRLKPTAQIKISLG